MTRREVFVADVAALTNMDEDEQFRVIAQMTHDAGIAANKVLAEQGEPLIEITPIDEVIEHLRAKYDRKAG